MRKTRTRFTALLLLSFSMLAACAKNANQQTGSGTQVEAPAAQELQRPAPALGMFISYYLAKGVSVPVRSATEGVDAQAKLYADFNPATLDDTYALLQEFGTILAVNIPDMLNRSSDRPQTLNEYIAGLENITARSQKLFDELGTVMTAIRKESRDQRTEVSRIQREINVAIKNQDYGTAGSLQQELNLAQAKLSAMDRDERQTREASNSFDRLLEVSEKRRDAIAKNREVLIAGLKVVDVPGTDDLGLINTKNGNTNPFGSF